MKRQTNYVTLIIAMIAAVNTALISFGVYHLDSDQLEAIDKVISVAATIIGVGISHRKGDQLPTKNK